MTAERLDRLKILQLLEELERLSQREREIRSEIQWYLKHDRPPPVANLLERFGRAPK